MKQPPVHYYKNNWERRKALLSQQEKVLEGRDIILEDIALLYATK